MTNAQSVEKGWRPIPMPLKVLAVLMVLWSLGSLLNLPNLMVGGLPLLGAFVYGPAALAVVLVLDFAGPLGFLYALWTRKAWGVPWAFLYIGLFLINSLVAVATVRDKLGTGPVLAPVVASALFLAVIYWKRAYFRQSA